MNMSEDSLLKSLRQIGGKPAPGTDLGGWYNYDPKFDWHKDDAGFAPGCTFDGFRLWPVTTKSQVRQRHAKSIAPESVVRTNESPKSFTTTIASPPTATTSCCWG
jgi:hypothetical protein